MFPRKLTNAEEQVLREQAITDDKPGTVLHDFGALLDAIGPGGVEASGKYHMLPIKLIGELDGLLSRPLKLEMKRPQIRSHPYLQGLNVLLRASGICCVEGTGATARLVVDPVMKMQWDQLNLTERYFNLLEAAFRFGRAEMVGEDSRASSELLWPCLVDWQHTPHDGKTFNSERTDHIYLMGVGRNWFQLALMDLFGLMKVEQPPVPITKWYPAGLRHTPFGDAVMNLLFSDRYKFHDTESEDEEDEYENDDEDEDALPQQQFGVWQSLFQPFFPEWERNLEIPTIEPRDGMFIFRVSLGKVWRLIAMPSEATLANLASTILDSVNFDHDHLYEFNYRDRLGSKRSVHSSEMDEGPFAYDVKIGHLPLEPKETMTFVFDFGDCWEFKVKLERIEPRGKQKSARILERHGKAPEQYPSWDE